MRSLETLDTLRTRSTLLAQRAWTSSFKSSFRLLRWNAPRPAFPLSVALVIMCSLPCLRHNCFFNELLQHQTLNHMRKLRDNTFVGNTGHIDNEIDFAASEGLEGTKVELQAYRTMSTSCQRAQ